MADRRRIQINKEWKEVPDVAGKTVMGQNVGVSQFDLVVTDGEMPDEAGGGEVLIPGAWTVEPIAIDSNEALFVRGTGPGALFVREVV